jgi:hypothetical protein
MRIVAEYSFKGGREVVSRKYPHLLREITQVIEVVDASKHLTKTSREKTMRGKKLYAPKKLNKSFKGLFFSRGWDSQRVKCDYPIDLYKAGYTPRPQNSGQFREMDFLKDKLGVELQFGKYAFMVYNVCAKMTIFRNLGHIDTGVEIVPVKSFADDMSSGVSYFEQFAWDLKARGVADIDIPVLILGIDA